MSSDRLPTDWPDVSQRVPLPTPPGSPPLCSAPSLPIEPCPVCPRLAQEFEPYRQAAFWKTMHQRALDREA